MPTMGLGAIDEECWMVYGYCNGQLDTKNKQVVRLCTSTVNVVIEE